LRSGQREIDRDAHPASQPGDRIGHAGIGGAHLFFQRGPHLRADGVGKARLVGEMVEEAALRHPGPRHDFVDRNGIDRAFCQQFEPGASKAVRVRAALGWQERGGAHPASYQH
jgi:hypothetical protein